MSEFNLEQLLVLKHFSFKMRKCRAKDVIVQTIIQIEVNSELHRSSIKSTKLLVVIKAIIIIDIRVCVCIWYNTHILGTLGPVTGTWLLPTHTHTLKCTRMRANTQTHFKVAIKDTQNLYHTAYTQIYYVVARAKYSRRLSRTWVHFSDLQVVRSLTWS